ncbi:YbaB/EbfC family nucleoid-associated protein [Amycolatopsis jiangsuensis]|uniref:DNA-binding protein YbaB n=1 Tax=Amycolatopsis jiangsuensis TaxID=1181879 RepID=A0A840J234_9PSEU|nr:YbaB/EbfC family nucleoid-associated protein [Amycolatopsis jiangsuensis]MBB4689076.1 DNA-binding protein YbaB [Amycolatopsis jiangsuensis]
MVDRVQAELAAEAADGERLAERIRRVQGGLAGITGTAESDDGLVSVTVDVRGAVTEVWLDPRIYRSPDSAALAEVIVRTCRAAADSAQRQAFDASVSVLPPDAVPGETDLAFDPVLYGLAREASR